MKTLKKVRLINWHRFQNETIPFAESVLLSGENGAGKSTILDAIQFVVTGSKAHFNKAAHEKGKRNLNSYIRCKTGRENQPYDRKGEISAHIALEFYDDAKKKPFIIGVVMDSASEEKEPNIAWYLLENCLLKDELFFKGRQVKGISAFRSTNSKDIKGFYQTITEAKKMMLSRFGRLEDKFFTLIPKALAFKPIHDIKDFVYSYVLDEKEVNIDILKENVRSYQDLERMLQDVKKRIAELELIREKEAEVQNALRRDRNYEYFIARADKELTEEELKKIQGNIQYQLLRKKDMEKRQQAEKEKREGKQEMIRSLQSELDSDKEYQAFRELERQEKELKVLMEEDKKEVQELKKAAKRALADAERLLLVSDADPIVGEYGEYLKKLEECEDLVNISLCIEKVIAYKTQMYKKVQEKIAEVRFLIREKQTESAELGRQIQKLESKQLVYSDEVVLLRDSILEQFRKLQRKPEVSVLCELLEITNPAWQNAVEGYLNTQRFYLLVAPENFDLALSVYDRLRSNKKAYGVGLINTGKLDAYDDVPRESLAEVVTSKNIWARRYINMVLGKVHRCNSYQELKHYPVSITRQCMRYQNHVVSAIRPAIYETPYIGAEAYKTQLEQCRKKKQQLDQYIENEKQRIDALESVEAPLGTENDMDVKYRLSALSAFRMHKERLEQCRNEMKQLNASQTILQKRIRLEALIREEKQLSDAISEVAQEIGRCDASIEFSKDQEIHTTDELGHRVALLAELAEKLAEDLGSCEKEYIRQREGKELSRFRENFEGTRKRNWTSKEKAENEMIKAMHDYKISHDFGAAESLSGFTEFLEEYHKLKDSQLLEFEEKVYLARSAAEEEFKEQFLSRLQENIKQAQGEFKELNRALKEIQFSRERYEFTHVPSKKLKKYYEMIMDDFNVLQGNSIFSSIFSETHKEVIEELFEKLTIDDDESNQTLEEFTDYRTYMDYDIKITGEDESYMLYSKVSQEKSGGETQTPFYITVAASFMQLYRNSIGGDSVGLIMMDEAFNNMDDERIAGVLSFMNHSNLQTIIAAPPDKIQYIGPAVKKILLVMQDDKVSYVEDFTHEAV